MYSAPTVQEIEKFLPAVCWASDKPSNGIFRAKREEAITFSHVSVNTKRLVNAILVDIDHPDSSMLWDDLAPEPTPRPTWLSTNPANGHSHAAFFLNAPVPTTEISHLKPLRFLAIIEESITRALSGDQAYTHLITKNPASSSWRTQYTGEKFDLADFLEYLPDSLLEKTKKSIKSKKKSEITGLSRNVDLFDSVRMWSYSEVRNYKKDGRSFYEWQFACETQTLLSNSFSNPLPTSETKAIARSIAKWTWRKMSYEGFVERQTFLGKKSAAKRKAKKQKVVERILEIS